MFALNESNSDTMFVRFASIHLSVSSRFFVSEPFRKQLEGLHRTSDISEDSRCLIEVSRDPQASQKHLEVFVMAVENKKRVREM